MGKIVLEDLMMENRQPLILYLQELNSLLLREEARLLNRYPEKIPLLKQVCEQIVTFTGFNGRPVSLHEISKKLSSLLDLINFKTEALNSDRFSQLTPREVEVLKMLAAGNSNKEIASQLYISINTVKHHRKLIKSKLQTTSMAELIKYAQAFDLI